MKERYTESVYDRYINKKEKEKERSVLSRNGCQGSIEFKDEPTTFH